MKEEQDQVQALTSPEARRWVNWRLVHRDGEEKATKVPYTPTGARASSTDTNTWSTYAEVVAAKEKFDGIGIMFDGSLLGIDLDHCIAEDRSVPPEISALIKAAKTYTEVSPSNEGLHLYLHLTEPLELERNRSGGYECYVKDRFFTVTENSYSESYPIRSVNSVEAMDLLKYIGYPWKKEEVATVVAGAESTPLEDAEVLSRMFESKNGAKIHALYDGDISAYDGDDSRADSALCAHLAYWTNNNAAQIKSLWLASPLGARAKTQKRTDYQKRTIENAISITKETVGNAKNASTISQTKEAIFQPFSEIYPVPVKWLWPNYIARGKVTMISGDPGLGKSLLTVYLAAVSSKGFPWPVTGENAPIGDTVMLSAEDDPADTIRPRLDAAGADVSRVYVLKAIKKTNADGTHSEHTFSLKEDIERLAQILDRLPSPQLVIIDPISAYLGSSSKESHNNAEMRSLLTPLSGLASRYGVAVVVVNHLNKDNGNTNAMYRAMGSLAFIAAVRAGYVVVRDKENPDRRLFLPTKNNLSKDINGFAWSIFTDENGQPVLAWEQKPVIVPKDEILSGPDSSAERTDTDWAVQVLEIILEHGPKPFLEVAAESRKAGITEKMLRRARQKLGVITKKEPIANGAWILELPSLKHAYEIGEDSSQEGDLDAEANIRNV